MYLMAHGGNHELPLADDGCSAIGLAWRPVMLKLVDEAELGA